MIPYIEHPVLDLGFYQLSAFRFLVLVAIVVDFMIVVRRAPRFGIDSADASRWIATTIVIGLVGAHVFDVITYFPERLADDPLELFRFWGSLSSTGGMLFGISGMAIVLWRAGIGWSGALRFSDAVIFALPFCLAIGRLGCALQHDHPGIASDHFLAVRFPDGARFDCGLLEFLVCVVIATVFLLLDRRSWPPGFYGLAFFALYGPARVVIDSLRIGDARYLGLTPAQYVTGIAALLAWAGLAWLLTRPSGSDEAHAA